MVNSPSVFVKQPDREGERSVESTTKLHPRAEGKAENEDRGKKEEEEATYPKERILFCVLTLTSERLSFVYQHAGRYKWTHVRRCGALLPHYECLKIKSSCGNW